MTKLDIAMKKHMENIIYNEHRPITFRDFLNFEINGKKYYVSHGTFRNKISTIFKNDVEVIYYSPIAYYTLKGVNLVNPMTGTQTGDHIYNHSNGNEYSHICNHPLYKVIKDLQFGKKSIHDLRLRLEVANIWSYLLSNSHQTSPSNQDICLLKCEENNIKFSVIVHKTNTVSVILGCTYFPIEIEIHGIMRLWITLAIIEERLRSKVNSDTVKIAHHASWIVTMWHFSKDALPSYSGEPFNAEFGLVNEMLIRIYAKEWKNGETRIRLEKQEYPMKSIEEAIEERINE